MKARGSGGATASVVHDNVVNQLLTKLDGMQSLDNVLVVGITNRGTCWTPRCCGPGGWNCRWKSGSPIFAAGANLQHPVAARARASNLLGDCVDVNALAAMTANYSGAEIKGLVGAAQSHALARYLAAFRETVSSSESEFPSESANESVVVTMPEDFSKALFEVRPALGADEEALDALRPLGTLCSCGTGTRSGPRTNARATRCPLCSARWCAVSLEKTPTTKSHADGVMETSESSFIESPVIETLLEDSPFFDRRWLSVLVHGPPGSGTSALTAEAASLVPFPSTRVFRSDVAAASGADLERALRAAFDDASKAKVSLLIVDGLDTLLGVPPGDVGFSPKGYSLSGGASGAPTTARARRRSARASPTASMVRSLRALRAAAAAGCTAPGGGGYHLERRRPCARWASRTRFTRTCPCPR